MGVKMKSSGSKKVSVKKSRTLKKKWVEEKSAGEKKKPTPARGTKWDTRLSPRIISSNRPPSALPRSSALFRLSHFDRRKVPRTPNFLPLVYPLAEMNADAPSSRKNKPVFIGPKAKQHA